jgi:DNA-binding CsgD family transcriptional regulator
MSTSRTRTAASEQRGLLGREREREQLRALVAGARKGQSGSLVVRGEPGIGKSALLDEAVAGAAGTIVLRSGGVGSETELPFSGLSELLAPLSGKVEALPPAQAAALSAALGLGPPVPGDPLTVAAATLSLLAAGADQNGLVAVVDDAHWVDRASLQALAFTARRLGAEGVVLLFAVRAAEPSILDAAELPELVLEGLDDAAARAVLERAAPTLAPPVAEIVLETAAGNPLALIEIPRALSQPEASGLRPILEPLRAGDVLERAYLRQLEGAPRTVVQALLVAAAAEPDEAGALALALPAVGTTWEELEGAEAGGYVSIEGGIRFRHPIMRSAVYHAAAATERRAAHRALAEALEECGALQRIAWHRALAQPAPNEDVASKLAGAGEQALARSAPGAAARALELAAYLTPETETRAGRHFAAAQASVFAGLVPRARELLDQALEQTNDSELRVDIQQLRARILVGGGAPFEAYAILTTEAARLKETDPARAALLYAEAAYGADAAARPAEANEASEYAYRLAEPLGGNTLLAAAISLSESLVLIGKVERALKVRPTNMEALEQANPLQTMHPGAAASFTAIAGREEESRRHLAVVVAALRSLSAPGLLVFPLAALAHIEFRLGRWREVHAAARESLDLGRAAGMTGFNAFALAALGQVEAGQGRFQEARDHAGQALEAGRDGTEVAFLYARPALVLTALGEGEAAEASQHGEKLAHLYEERGYCAPGVSCWHANVIEAYIRAGRRVDAERLSERFGDEAVATRHPWALAASSRCRALLAEEEGFEELFATSLSLHEHVPNPFERARTELALGEARRRARRRADAREPLRRALATFEDLGAAPWAARAHDELRACGARPRRRAHGPTDELSPHELRVAQVVAAGATNKEAASALFLSPKTIDFHLQNVFRKLGVSSRTQLANRLPTDVDVGVALAADHDVVAAPGTTA